MCVYVLRLAVCAGQCDGLLGRLARRPVECTVRVQALPERGVPRVGRVRGRNLGSHSVVWFTAIQCLRVFLSIEHFNLHTGREHTFILFFVCHWFNETSPQGWRVEQLEYSTRAVDSRSRLAIHKAVHNRRHCVHCVAYGAVLSHVDLGPVHEQFGFGSLFDFLFCAYSCLRN